ncbi:MAG: FeoB small GTPase domain-containing protein, partial [Candidatus Latescibacteria bacterium]|nr:FeoB small GTPase domain-containing protein [Candidatus Latescibacterota bacterium]
MSEQIVVALAGNPNSGKTTLFNNLTGTRQHVGNYPGVTVERKEGVCRHGSKEIRVIDLPGTYSLTAYSTEEVVARNVIIDEKPDIVVVVIDASNLERNLYLAVQIKELGVPMVMAFNMSDTARARGHVFDTEKLSGFFGAPIVQTVGHKGMGMRELLDAIVSAAGERKNGRDGTIDYGREIEEEVSRIQKLVEEEGSPSARNGRARWTAVKLLENDGEVRSQIDSHRISDQVEKSAARVEEMLGEPPETAI